MSKIFNFLSFGTYSRLSVNFFRFPLRFGVEGGIGNRREQPLSLEEILQKAKFAIRYFSENKNTHFRYPILYMIKDYYSKLNSKLEEYKQTGKIPENKHEQALYQEAERIFAELSEIIENNCRNPR